MDIKPLSDEVRGQLRSGTCNINNIPHCIMELIYNSLDANASSIAVRINILTFRLQVVDNGCGISKKNLEKIAERYMSSKCHSLKDYNKHPKFYGYRGESLASVRQNCGRLTIASRVCKSTYSKSFEDGKCGDVVEITHRPCEGTTVTVEDFLKNLPVRKSRVNSELDLEGVRNVLANLAIIHPSVNFSLRNDITKKIVFQSQPSDTVEEAFLKAHDEINASHLSQLKITKGKVSIVGLIYKQVLRTNKYQYVYVNKRPVTVAQIANVILDVFGKSSVCKNVAKSCQNFAYILNIRCPHACVQYTTNSAKTVAEFSNWDVIAKCVERVLINCLQKSGMSFDKLSEVVEDVDKESKELNLMNIGGAIMAKATKRKRAGVVKSSDKRSETTKEDQLETGVKNKNIVNKKSLGRKCNTGSIRNMIKANNYKDNKVSTSNCSKTTKSDHMVDDVFERNIVDEVVNKKISPKRKQTLRLYDCSFTKFKKARKPANKNQLQKQVPQMFDVMGDTISVQSLQHNKLDEYSNNNDIEDQNLGKAIILGKFLESVELHGEEPDDSIYEEQLERKSTVSISRRIKSRGKHKRISSERISNVSYTRRIHRKRRKRSELVDDTIEAIEMVSKCMQTTLLQDHSLKGIDEGYKELETREIVNTEFASYKNTKSCDLNTGLEGIEVHDVNRSVCSENQLQGFSNLKTLDKDKETLLDDFSISNMTLEPSKSVDNPVESDVTFSEYFRKPSNKLEDSNVLSKRKSYVSLNVEPNKDLNVLEEREETFFKHFPRPNKISENRDYLSKYKKEKVSRPQETLNFQTGLVTDDETYSQYFSCSNKYRSKLVATNQQTKKSNFKRGLGVLNHTKTDFHSRRLFHGTTNNLQNSKEALKILIKKPLKGILKNNKGVEGSRNLIIFGQNATSKPLTGIFGPNKKQNLEFNKPKTGRNNKFGNVIEIHRNPVSKKCGNQFNSPLLKCMFKNNVDINLLTADDITFIGTINDTLPSTCNDNIVEINSNDEITKRVDEIMANVYKNVSPINYNKASWDDETYTYDCNPSATPRKASILFDQEQYSLFDFRNIDKKQDFLCDEEELHYKPSYVKKYLKGLEEKHSKLKLYPNKFRSRVISNDLDLQNFTINPNMDRCFRDNYGWNSNHGSDTGPLTYLNEIIDNNYTRNVLNTYDNSKYKFELNDKQAFRENKNKDQVRVLRRGCQNPNQIYRNNRSIPFSTRNAYTHYKNGEGDDRRKLKGKKGRNLEGSNEKPMCFTTGYTNQDQEPTQYPSNSYEKPISLTIDEKNHNERYFENRKNNNKFFEPINFNPIKFPDVEAHSGMADNTNDIQIHLATREIHDIHNINYKPINVHMPKFLDSFEDTQHYLHPKKRKDKTLGNSKQKLAVPNRIAHQDFNDKVFDSTNAKVRHYVTRKHFEDREDKHLHRQKNIQKHDDYNKWEQKNANRKSMRYLDGNPCVDYGTTRRDGYYENVNNRNQKIMHNRNTLRNNNDDITEHEHYQEFRNLKRHFQVPKLFQDNNDSKDNENNYEWDQIDPEESKRKQMHSTITRKHHGEVLNHLNRKPRHFSRDTKDHNNVLNYRHVEDGYFPHRNVDEHNNYGIIENYEEARCPNRKLYEHFIDEVLPEIRQEEINFSSKQTHQERLFNQYKEYSKNKMDYHNKVVRRNFEKHYPTSVYEISNDEDRGDINQNHMPFTNINNHETLQILRGETCKSNNDRILIHGNNNNWKQSKFPTENHQNPKYVSYKCNNESNNNEIFGDTLECCNNDAFKYANQKNSRFPRRNDNQGYNTDISESVQHNPMHFLTSNSRHSYIPRGTKHLPMHLESSKSDNSNFNQYYNRDMLDDNINVVLEDVDDRKPCYPKTKHNQGDISNATRYHPMSYSSPECGKYYNQETGNNLNIKASSKQYDDRILVNRNQETVQYRETNENNNDHVFGNENCREIFLSNIEPRENYNEIRVPCRQSNKNNNDDGMLEKSNPKTVPFPRTRADEDNDNDVFLVKSNHKAGPYICTAADEDNNVSKIAESSKICLPPNLQTKDYNNGQFACRNRYENCNDSITENSKRKRYYTIKTYKDYNDEDLQKPHQQLHFRHGSTYQERFPKSFLVFQDNNEVTNCKPDNVVTKPNKEECFRTVLGHQSRRVSSRSEYKVENTEEINQQFNSPNAYTVSSEEESNRKFDSTLAYKENDDEMLHGINQNRTNGQLKSIMTYEEENNDMLENSNKPSSFRRKAYEHNKIKSQQNTHMDFNKNSKQTKSRDLLVKSSINVNLNTHTKNNANLQPNLNRSEAKLDEVCPEESDFWKGHKTRETNETFTACSKKDSNQPNLKCGDTKLDGTRNCIDEDFRKNDLVESNCAKELNINRNYFSFNTNEFLNKSNDSIFHTFGNSPNTNRNDVFTCNKGDTNDFDTDEFIRKSNGKDFFSFGNGCPNTFQNNKLVCVNVHEVDKNLEKSGVDKLKLNYNSPIEINIVKQNAVNKHKLNYNSPITRNSPKQNVISKVDTDETQGEPNISVSNRYCSEMREMNCNKSSANDGDRKIINNIKIDNLNFDLTNLNCNKRNNTSSANDDEMKNLYFDVQNLNSSKLNNKAYKSDTNNKLSGLVLISNNANINTTSEKQCNGIQVLSNILLLHQPQKSPINQELTKSCSTIEKNKKDKSAKFRSKLNVLTPLTEADNTKNNIPTSTNNVSFDNDTALTTVNRTDISLAVDKKSNTTLTIMDYDEREKFRAVSTVRNYKSKNQDVVQIFSNNKGHTPTENTEYIISNVNCTSISQKLKLLKLLKSPVSKSGYLEPSLAKHNPFDNDEIADIDYDFPKKSHSQYFECPISEISFNLAEKDNVVDITSPILHFQKKNNDISLNLTTGINDEQDAYLSDSYVIDIIQECGRNSPEWIENQDPNGKKFHVHKRTGMTTAKSPNREETYNMKKRIDSVPKGCSPMLSGKELIETSMSESGKKTLYDAIMKNYENELGTIKWQNINKDGVDPLRFFDPIYHNYKAKMAPDIPDISNQGLTKFGSKSHKGFNEKTFTKDIFNDLTVIGQLDKKFIIALAADKSLLLLFDQHAVHERIRVEQLQNDYNVGSANGLIEFKTTALRTNLTINPSVIAIQIMNTYREVFENIGMRYTIVDGDVLHVLEVPSCIYNKCNRDKDKTNLVELLICLIEELVETLQITRGTLSATPKVIQNVINMEACRGAVMFGDVLTSAECICYLKALSICKLPFQCAHGRPTVTPLIELKQLQNKINKQKRNKDSCKYNIIE